MRLRTLQTVFIISLLCVTTLGDRFFPERSKMFAKEDYGISELDFNRLLEDSSETQNNGGNQSQDSDSLVTIRLKGDTELGYYYATLFFGLPVQKQTLIVDTGSVTTTIPCTECGENCGQHHFDGPFEHGNSATFKELECQDTFGEYICNDCTSTPCGFSVAYVEGSSYSGHFTKDYVSFGNEIEDYFIRKLENNQTQSQNTSDSRAQQEIDHDRDDNHSTENQAKELQHHDIEKFIEKRKVYMPFGCTDRETKLFYAQEADGILGLGVRTNTRDTPPNIVDALKISHPKHSRAFSLCLAQDGGYFTIGGHNTTYHNSDDKIHYTSYSTDYGQYKVYLNKVEAQGKNLNLSAKALNHGEGAFFDSGTTYTHVPSETYNAIKTFLTDFCQEGEKACGNNPMLRKDLCFAYIPSEFATVEEYFSTFPSFKFYFGENGAAEYEWKPEDYLYKKNNKEMYCMGLSKYERETILGGTFMKNHDILFDKDNQKIGFVRANCEAVNGLSAPLPSTDDEPSTNSQPSGQAEPKGEDESNGQNESNGNDEPNKQDESNGTDTSIVTEVQHDNRGSRNLIMILVSLLACTIIGFVVYRYIKYAKKNKHTYELNEVEVVAVKDQETSSNITNNNDINNQDSARTEGESESVIQSVVEI